MNLLDASALLCFLQGEPGAEVVARALGDQSACSAANWSEVSHKFVQHDRDFGMAKSWLKSLGLQVVPVLEVDAEAAAQLWQRNSHLSLGDRICLATGRRLNAVIWTADKAWGSHDNLRQIR